MTEIIRIEELRKDFGHVTALEDVSLSIEEGEFVTLLGASGCGKSTLLRLIGGFEAPTRGRILLDGKDVTDVPPNRRDVNMVFQDYALFPHMNVERNVGHSLRVRRTPKRETRERTQEALELVGLADKSNALPHQLSGGQRQRVALARAIIRHPKVLLLDEPLSALDANLREQMQGELKRLHKMVGITFILVTHDQKEALTMSDRVVVMRDGRLVEEGTPRQLYDRPKTVYVAGFIGTTNLFFSRVEQQNGHPTITCFGQSLRVPPNLHGDADRETLFGFRPEHASLQRGADQREAVLRGQVADVWYEGTRTRVNVDLGPGKVLVDCGNAELGTDLANLRQGEPVTVWVDPVRVLTFPDESRP